MPRPRNAVPQPREHKGRAVLDVYENGVRRTRTLGAWGSPDAGAEYRKLLAEFGRGGAGPLERSRHQRERSGPRVHEAPRD
jgi:hypothetical protein